MFLHEIDYVNNYIFLQLCGDDVYDCIFFTIDDVAIILVHSLYSLRNFLRNLDT